MELRRSGEVQTVLFMASDRLVNVFIPPVLEYQVRGFTIHDEIAPTGLGGHKKLSDIYRNNFASMADRVKMGRIICLLHFNLKLLKG